jgi:hypothetical protein
MMALIPVCKREREDAKSHADTAGIPAIGVGVEDVIGVAVGDAREVAVDSATFVSVGEGRGV